MPKRPEGNKVTVVSELLNTNMDTMIPKNKSVRRIITWDSDFYAQVENCAKKKRMSVSAFVRQCVAEKLEEMDF